MSKSFPIYAIWEMRRISMRSEIRRLVFLLSRHSGGIPWDFEGRKSQLGSRDLGPDEARFKGNEERSRDKRGKPFRHADISNRLDLSRAYVVALCQVVPSHYFVVKPHILVAEIPLLYIGDLALLVKGF